MVYSEQTHACKSGIQDCDCNTFHFPDMILRYFWFLKKVISVVADDSTGKWKSNFPTLPMLGNISHAMGAQWLSGRVLDSRPRGRRFEPHRRHCVVVLQQDTFFRA